MAVFVTLNNGRNKRVSNRFGGWERGRPKESYKYGVTRRQLLVEVRKRDMEEQFSLSEEIPSRHEKVSPHYGSIDVLCDQVGSIMLSDTSWDRPNDGMHIDTVHGLVLIHRDGELVSAVGDGKAPYSRGISKGSASRSGSTSTATGTLTCLTVDSFDKSFRNGRVVGASVRLKRPL